MHKCTFCGYEQLEPFVGPACQACDRPEVVKVNAKRREAAEEAAEKPKRSRSRKA